MGSLSLLCQFSPSPCTAGQECWGGLCQSSMQNTRVGAKRTMQSRASNKTESGDPPSALCRAVKRETRGWGGWEGARGAAGKNPGEGLKEERPPQGSRWVPSEQDAHGAPGPSQRRGAGGGVRGEPGQEPPPLPPGWAPLSAVLKPGRSGAGGEGAAPRPCPISGSSRGCRGGCGAGMEEPGLGW